MATATGRAIAVVNPATGARVGDIEHPSRAEVERRIAAARAAQPAWGRAPRHARYETLVGFSRLVDAERESLAALLSAESGKPLAQTLSEMALASRLFRRFAERMLALKEDAHFLDSQVGLEGDLVVTRREPLGVVVAILPFNFPAELFAHKVAPALAMGNAVLVKPPLEDPLTVKRLGELLGEAGVPADVAQVVGGGADVGGWLVDSDLVDGVSLTGSTETGIEVARTSARTLKRVALELGGNDAMVVLDDADLALAVEQAVLGRTLANGQCCCANKRVLVQRGILHEFTDALAARFAAVRIGDPSAEDTELGPLIHDRAAARVEAQVQTNVNAGARIAIGGSRRDTYYGPTVLVDVEPDMPVARDMEIFGPVLALLAFDSDGEAARISNLSRYGLSGSVFSRDTRRAMAVAAELDTGQVVVNGTGLYRPDVVGFGGRRFSGHAREGLETSLEEFVLHKNIALPGLLRVPAGNGPSEREVAS